jgi:PAS domain S-box-containing protein
MDQSADPRQLLDALRSSEARLRAVIECLPFDFWMIGMDGTYVMQNSTCRELWGEVVGKRPEDLGVEPSTLALWQTNNRRAFAGESVRSEVMFRTRGKMRHYLNVIVPILQEGETTGILGINVDITDSKVAEQELRQKNEELRQANERLAALSREKDRMNAMISHELRTPLVTGLGYVQMLLEHKLGPISERAESRMLVAKRSLQRLSRLIDLVLQYQGLFEVGQHELSRVALFDLRELAKELVDEFRDAGEALPRVGVGLEFDADLPRVLGDRELIRMVLANLLNNALAYAGPAAHVRIIGRRVPEDRVEITVQDFGIGIPGEIRESVFEPFVRGQGDQQGFGLGLSIVRAILSAHHSDVTLTSEEGKGTAVTFHLPASG